MEALKVHNDLAQIFPPVAIFGKGWVGSHIASFFKNAELFDENNSSKDLHKKYPFGFICVPTPNKEDGECDTSIVESVLNEYAKCVEIFIVCSTVPVGFCDSMKSRGFRIVFQPEQIAESSVNPYKDGHEFMIFGGDKVYTKALSELWTLVVRPSMRFIFTDNKSAELSKLEVNNFLAVKVAFFNNIYEIAEKQGLNYAEVREIVINNELVGRNHTMVYKNNQGYGGKCLPKDLDNTISFCNSARIDCEILESTKAYNTKINSQNRS